MKKTLLAIILGIIPITLSACLGVSVQSGGEKPATHTTTESAAQSAEQSEADVEEPIDSETADDKANILVAYFSCTGNTKTIAEYAADCLNAELYEITPAILYTDADLDYNDSNSRCSIEMNDLSVRPEITGTVSDMPQYDTVLIAYPIWWGKAPRIICTFTESYDFSGKTIIPFCTSGSSPIGASADELEKLTSGADWISGKRFGAGTPRNEIANWLNELGFTVKE